MDDSEILEQRYRFFAEKAATLSFEQDKILVTLFTGIVAGLVALVVSKQVGYWSALFFVISDLSAVVGLGMCLLHMAFSSKVMGLFAAMFAGEENVPNLIAREEPTPHALQKNRVFAQTCYAGQLTCLFWSVTFAGLGILAIVWDTVGWTGVIVGLVFLLGFIIAVLRPLITVYRLARVALAEKETTENVDAE